MKLSSGVSHRYSDGSFLAFETVFPDVLIIEDPFFPSRPSSGSRKSTMVGYRKAPSPRDLDLLLLTDIDNTRVYAISRPTVVVVLEFTEDPHL